MPSGIVALLTDFADRDGFVGAVKGRILSQNPEAGLVDVAHHIPAQDIRHAGWVLTQVYDTFPEGTWFMCVVDPGVGDSEQAALLVYDPQTKKGCIAPDNGLLSRLMGQRATTPWQVRVVNRTRPLFGTISHTFHARDVYAPLAGYISFRIQANTDSTECQRVLNELGQLVPVTSLSQLNFPTPHKLNENEWQCHVDTLDTYGNIITTLPNHQFNWLIGTRVCLKGLGKNDLTAYVVDHYRQLNTYGLSGDVAGLIQGSHGAIEVVAFQQSAATRWVQGGYNIGQEPGLLSIRRDGSS